MPSFSHVNKKGDAHMVDISEKKSTARMAKARSIIQCIPEVIDNIHHQQTIKGDVIATARIAGIQAAKQCSNLIPLCHPLPLSKVSIDIEIKQSCIEIIAVCKTNGKTGVEMEALTAAAVTSLTIYDMCKSIDKGMIISETKLLEKTGGKLGNYRAESKNDEF